MAHSDYTPISGVSEPSRLNQEQNFIFPEVRYVRHPAACTPASGSASPAIGVLLAAARLAVELGGAVERSFVRVRAHFQPDGRDL